MEEMTTWVFVCTKRETESETKRKADENSNPWYTDDQIEEKSRGKWEIAVVGEIF